MRIYLTRQNFEALTHLRREERVDPNELINLLVSDWFKTRGEQKEQPKYECGIADCSFRFYSKDALTEHVKRRHQQKPLQNETPA